MKSLQSHWGRHLEFLNEGAYLYKSETQPWSQLLKTFTTLYISVSNISEVARRAKHRYSLIAFSGHSDTKEHWKLVLPMNNR